MVLNPFATRFVQPDRVPLVGYDGATLRDWADQVVRSETPFQVTGPHGSGKTTLTHGILAALRQTDWAQTEGGGGGIRWLTIGRQWQLRGWLGGIDLSLGDGSRLVPGMIVMDGLEHLPWTGRQGLIQACRDRGIRLLVTTHRIIRRVPVLVQVNPSPERLQQIVAALSLDPAARAMLTRGALDRIYHQRQGNLRECLMSCYDQVEHLRRQETAGPGEGRRADPTGCPQRQA